MNAVPKILVTDDVAANRIAMRKLLRKLDVEVLEAEDGNKALQLALSVADIALVLMDVQMPGMDGYETAALMRGEAGISDIPIIFLTAVAREQSHELNGYKCGGVDFIQKPVDPEILLSKVTIFVEMWRAKALLMQEVLHRSQAEEKIRHLARHDQLTHLPNRSQLLDNLGQGISRVDRYGGYLCVLFLDLDGFKPVNDEYGHEAGDHVLIEIAGRLKNMMRPTDTVARFGGDEFVVLMTDVQEMDCIVPKLQSVVTACASPIDWLGNQLQLGVSLGVASYPGNGANGKELIAAADKAMYKAKDSGKNCFRFYADGQFPLEKRYKQTSECLQKAIANNELYLLYQGILSVKTLEVVAAEALLRWDSKELGALEPISFLPVAESNGQIEEIGHWVVRQALCDAIHWSRLGGRNIRVMVNLSNSQLSDEKFVSNINQFVSPLLAQEGKTFSAEDLCTLLGVEVKERVLANPLGSVTEQLRSLADSGLELSIDNVGLDVSAFNFIKDNLASQVKIDRAVVAGIGKDEAREKIVRSLIAVAHIFNMEVIATGIETAQQFEFLRDNGCDYVQGYYFCDALNAGEFEAYIAEHLPREAKAAEVP